MSVKWTPETAWREYMALVRAGKVRGLYPAVLNRPGDDPQFAAPTRLRLNPLTSDTSRLTGFPAWPNEGGGGE